MNLQEALATSLANLAGHKLRSALTMLGVVFGVGAVISMLSIGAGAEREAMEMISRLGLRNVLLRAKTFEREEAQEIRKQSPGLSLRDTQAILDAVPGVELIAPKVEIDPWQVIAAGAKTQATVLGVTDRHRELASLELASGRFLDGMDLLAHEQVAVIGPAVARDLFGYEPALGRDLKVDDVWLQVVGVLAGTGSESDSFEGVSIGSTDRVVYLPVTTALSKFDRDPLDSPLSEIVVRLASSGPGTDASGADSRTAARVIDRLVGQLHAGAEDYELVVPEALLEQSRRTQRLFSLVMGSIAGISLLVGGIGIMNIMLATVLERTREIGVRRAVGARRRDILEQFLVESFAISALGGAIGVLMGLGIARGIAASAGWPTVVTPWSILLAVGVAVAVGMISGFYPARRAAELDPIESLRYE
ncbi:MAG TPA: ABC transporter permease [Thermoanaerobaculia bacterium]|nr:ABC transporter permease [Thermoanaerobaculia bacterium]